MPRIMNLIHEELAQEEARMYGGSGMGLSDAEKQAVQEIMRDLPSALPKWVQNRVLRKRKNMQRSNMDQP